MSHAEAKVYLRKKGAYRGRVKAHKGRDQPDAYKLPDGPEGLIKLGKALKRWASKHRWGRPGPNDGSLHSVVVNFYQGEDAHVPDPEESKERPRRNSNESEGDPTRQRDRK